jgi:hypothetical protein
VAPAPALPSPTPGGAPAPGSIPNSPAQMDALASQGTTKVTGNAIDYGALAESAAPSLASAGLSSGLSLGLAPKPQMPNEPASISGSALKQRDRERQRRSRSARSSISSSLGSAMGARSGRTTLGGGY